MKQLSVVDEWKLAGLKEIEKINSFVYIVFLIGRILPSTGLLIFQSSLRHDLRCNAMKCSIKISIIMNYLRSIFMKEICLVTFYVKAFVTST